MLLLLLWKESMMFNFSHFHGKDKVIDAKALNAIKWAYLMTLVVYEHVCKSWKQKAPPVAMAKTDNSTRFFIYLIIVGQTICHYVPVASDSSIYYYFVHRPPTSMLSGKYYLRYYKYYDYSKVKERLWLASFNMIGRRVFYNKKFRPFLEGLNLGIVSENEQCNSCHWSWLDTQQTRY